MSRIQDINKFIEANPIKREFAAELAKHMHQALDGNRTSMRLEMDERGVLSNPAFVFGGSHAIQYGNNIVLCIETRLIDEARHDLDVEEEALKRHAAMKSLFSAYLQSFTDSANGASVTARDNAAVAEQWAVSLGVAGGIHAREWRGDVAPVPVGFERFCGLHDVAMKGV